VREPKWYFGEIRSRKMPKDIVALTSHILETKGGHFDPSTFKDQYETALKALVRRKNKGEPIEPPEEKEASSNVINLMDALRQSLGKRKGEVSEATAPHQAKEGHIESPQSGLMAPCLRATNRRRTRRTVV
jgi:non-homologous end joining protein Ku